jgi:hypothetical protein
MVPHQAGQELEMKMLQPHQETANLDNVNFIPYIWRSE